MMSRMKELYTELTLATEDHLGLIYDALERGEIASMLVEIESLKNVVEKYGEKSGAL
jgi:hypothetical protein